MKYFVLEPEVAGGIGKKSEVLYENSKIKEVLFLDYEFEYSIFSKNKTLISNLLDKRYFINIPIKILGYILVL